MADRPIIFSAPMVRALIKGRKTQTRRVLRDPTGSGWYRHPETSQIIGCMGNPPPRLPYAVRDRLWVREAWAPLDACTHRDPGVAALAAGCFHRADYPVDCGDVSRWRPSIHMPRWASRLTLTVTDERVQRLQEISEKDARAEGVLRPMKICDDDVATYFEAFADLWISLHGPAAWDANPWVCAVTFTVERRNIDAGAA